MDHETPIPRTTTRPRPSLPCGQHTRPGGYLPPDEVPQRHGMRQEIEETSLLKEREALLDASLASLVGSPGPLLLTVDRLNRKRPRRTVN